MNMMAVALTASLLPGGWVPAPQESFDRPAGVLCDVPIHVEAAVDEVVSKDVPGGTIYKGKLVERVTNTGTGRYTDADASGTAYVQTAADGTQTWYVAGPVLIGYREGAGSLPRGLYLIDGVFRLVLAPDGHKELTMVRGSTRNLCPLVS